MPFFLYAKIWKYEFLGWLREKQILRQLLLFSPDFTPLLKPNRSNAKMGE
ncbi:hypothetical protein [Nostoc sp. MS1]|nr:hypothetical protein [Nostoc sp. MS1]